MKNLALLTLPWIMVCCGGSEGENDADMDSMDSDADPDIYQCPPAPDCPEDQVIGHYALSDPEGCLLYCCVGALVEFSDVSVTSDEVVEVSGSVSVEALGSSTETVRIDMISAELRLASDGSPVGTCDGIDPTDPDLPGPIDLTLGCTLTVPEPCGEALEIVFAYTWHTDGCMASDHGTLSAGALFECADP